MRHCLEPGCPRQLRPKGAEPDGVTVEHCGRGLCTVHYRKRLKTGGFDGFPKVGPPPALAKPLPADLGDALIGATEHVIAYVEHRCSACGLFIQPSAACPRCPVILDRVAKVRGRLAAKAARDRRRMERMECVGCGDDVPADEPCPTCAKLRRIGRRRVA